MAKRKKQNNKGVALVAVGAVLMLSALSLFVYNQKEDENAGEQAAVLLQDIHAAIERKQPAPTPAETPSAPAQSEPEPTPTPFDPTLPEVEIQGYNCVGFLTIPAMELEVPVISQWDYERLKSAPCRQYGSTKTDDLVIAAHNYDRHFGKLKNLVAGDTVIFTDMDGNVNTYSVTGTTIVEPEAVEAVYGSGSDLVLYTCTKGGKTRVVAFCQRTGVDG